MIISKHTRIFAVALVLGLSACGGGGGSNGSTVPSPPPPPPPATGAFADQASTARFLTQTTFGVTKTDIVNLTGTSASDWFIAELSKPRSLNLDYVLTEVSKPESQDANGMLTFSTRQTPTFSFWRNAVEGDDQLRQRMAYALSQILVVSHSEGNDLFQFPFTVADYQDILVDNAFGNYRDLLEDVTYSPAMGIYLTYLRNTKGNPATGQMPDENYAREVMQLFSIGLSELNQDGTVRLDAGGLPTETYTNADVTGLAKVFTGLSLNGPNFYSGFDQLNADALWSPMVVFANFHSDLDKSFLGTTIPMGMSAEQSIDLALDALVDHENTPPFVSRQLIQRFVTSHPQPEYVERVADAFATGTYTLPSGSIVGLGQRGDLTATLAAVLFDDEARTDSARSADDYGKLREPVLRFTNWARAFEVATVTPELTRPLWNTSTPTALGQHPYKAPSVFNFYRPGYLAPGTETGAAGLTMPELQLVNANTVSGYANFMTYFVLSFAANDPSSQGATSFIPDYTDEMALVDDIPALLDHLDLLLTYNTASPETKATIATFLNDIPLSDPNDPNYDGPAIRVGLAVLMMLTTPDYLVQR